MTTWQAANLRISDGSNPSPAAAGLQGLLQWAATKSLQCWLRLVSCAVRKTGLLHNVAATAGNGEVSNETPYGHFTYNFQDVLTTYNYSCVINHVSFAYDAYTGNSSYTQMQNPAFFNSTTGRNK